MARPIDTRAARALLGCPGVRGIGCALELASSARASVPAKLGVAGLRSAPLSLGGQPLLPGESLRLLRERHWGGLWSPAPESTLGPELTGAARRWLNAQDASPSAGGWSPNLLKAIGDDRLLLRSSKPGGLPPQVVRALHVRGRGSMAQWRVQLRDHIVGTNHDADRALGLEADGPPGPAETPAQLELLLRSAFREAAVMHAPYPRADGALEDVLASGPSAEFDRALGERGVASLYFRVGRGCPRCRETRDAGRSVTPCIGRLSAVQSVASSALVVAGTYFCYSPKHHSYREGSAMGEARSLEKNSDVPLVEAFASAGRFLYAADVARAGGAGGAGGAEGAEGAEGAVGLT